VTEALIIIAAAFVVGVVAAMLDDWLS